MAVADLLRRDEADALVRDAYMNVHRYPDGFPGFRARVRMSDEESVVVGRATLRPGVTPAVDVDADADSRGWLERELVSMTGHRWHHDYAAADGRYDKDISDGPEGALGRIVHLDDPTLSTYWIENGHITRIGRSVDAGRLSILIQDRLVAPDGRWVASHFAVVLRDEVTGDVTSTSVYRDAFVERWGLLLPCRRRAVTISREGSCTRELVLDHHDTPARGRRAA